MEEKITPDKINNFLLLVEKQIRFMEKDINTLEKFGSTRGNDTKSMSINILTKELERLKNDLETFRHTDVDHIKNSIFGEKFTILLEELS